ncbi:unnamed protein product [Dicrocoelium dendriticum]|nr:unnamed protein product [Dicrocoelium dendriticum]
MVITLNILYLSQLLEKMAKSSLSDRPAELGCFGIILLGLSYLFIIITFPLSLCFTTKVIAEYERAVIFRLGRILQGGARGPGLLFIVPCLDRVRKVDLRTVTFDVPPQEVRLRDLFATKLVIMLCFNLWLSSFIIYDPPTNLWQH